MKVILLTLFSHLGLACSDPMILLIFWRDKTNSSVTFYNTLKINNLI